MSGVIHHVCKRRGAEILVDSDVTLATQHFLRVHFHAGTYDNVKALVSAGAIPLLLDVARAFEEDSATLSVVYLALKQLAANDESVKLVGPCAVVAICRCRLAMRLTFRSRAFGLLLPAAKLTGAESYV